MLYAVLDLEENFVEERFYVVVPPAIKPGPGGRPLLRPLTVTEPVVNPWQEISGFVYDVQELEVVKNPVVINRDLSNFKQQKLSQVDNLLLSKLEQGFEWPPVSGKRVQVRPQDQSNIASSTLRAIAVLTSGGSLTWPNDFEWRMLDNTFIQIATPQAMLGMAVSAMDFVVSLRKVAWDHKDAISQLNTTQTIHEYNINANW